MKGVLWSIICYLVAFIQLVKISVYCTQFEIHRVKCIDAQPLQTVGARFCSHHYERARLTANVILSSRGTPHVVNQ